MPTTMANIHSRSRETDSVCHWSYLDEYDVEEQVFYRTDGAVVIMMEVVPAPSLNKPNHMLADEAESIAQWISGMTENETISFTYYSSKIIDAALGKYRQTGGEQTPILQQMRTIRERFIAVGVDNAYFDFAGTKADFRTRLLRTVITITVPPQQAIGILQGIADAARAGIFRKTHPSRVRFEKQRQALVRRAQDIRLQLTSKLSMMGCEILPLDEHGAISIIRELVYPKTGHRGTLADRPWEKIYERIPLTQVTIDSDRGRVESEGAIYRVLTLQGHPVKTHPGMVTLPVRRMGGRSFIEYLDRGFVTLTLRAKSKNFSRNHLRKLAQDLGGGWAMPGRGQEAARQVGIAQTWLESEGRTFFQVEMIATTWGEDERDADERILRFRDRLSENIGKVNLEHREAPDYFLRALPGNATPPIQMANRYTLLCDRQVVDLMPLWFRSRGTKEAMMLIHSATGEPFALSPWGGSSYGFMVAGKPGVGKSVFVQLLILDFLCHPQSQVIMFDKGKSYLTLTMLFGDKGSYLDVAQGGGCFNPCYGTYDQAKKHAVSAIARMASPPGREPISQAQAGIIEEILRAIFAQNRISTTYHDLAELRTRYPDAFIDFAGKRMRAQFVSAEIQKRISAQSTEDRNLRIYYRYHLHQEERRDQDRARRNQPGERIDVVSLARLLARTRQFLLGKGFTLKDEGDGVVAFHQAADQADILAGNGIHSSLDQTTCELDVDTTDTVRLLELAGVVFIIPDEVKVAVANQERERIRTNPEYAQATAETIEKRITRTVQDANGATAFGALVGHAIIQREATLSDFCAELEIIATDKTNQEHLDLLRRLRPFCGEGAYARYFDGRSTVNFAAAKIIDIELGNLKENMVDHPFGCLFANMLYNLRQYAMAEEVRGYRKMIILEEAWQLFQDDKGTGTSTLIGDAITALYRVGRKHGIATGVVTQGVNDLIKTTSGREILENAATRFIFKQSDTAVNDVAKSLGLTPEEGAMLASLKSDPGYYSQVLVQALEQNPPVFDVGYIIMHPLQYWLTTTEPVDVAYREMMVEELMLKGVPEEDARRDAIRMCAQQYRRGRARAS